jgi:hypothetical protein
MAPGCTPAAPTSSLVAWCRVEDDVAPRGRRGEGAALYAGSLLMGVIVAPHRWWRWHRAARRQPRHGCCRCAPRVVEMAPRYTPTAL